MAAVVASNAIAPAVVVAAIAVNVAAPSPELLSAISFVAALTSGILFPTARLCFFRCSLKDIITTSRAVASVAVAETTAAAVAAVAAVVTAAVLPPVVSAATTAAVLPPAIAAFATTIAVLPPAPLLPQPPLLPCCHPPLLLTHPNAALPPWLLVPLLPLQLPSL